MKNKIVCNSSLERPSSSPVERTRCTSTITQAESMNEILEVRTCASVCVDVCILVFVCVCVCSLASCCLLKCGEAGCCACVSVMTSWTDVGSILLQPPPGWMLFLEKTKCQGQTCNIISNLRIGSRRIFLLERTKNVQFCILSAAVK